MSTKHSITDLLPGVKNAEEAAVVDLFVRYYARVVDVARRKLDGMPQRGFDADDVAASAFRDFLHSAAKGKFPTLESREDVHKLLVVLVVQKKKRYLRKERAKKRGGGVRRT